MTIEKINFSYPKGSLQSVFDTEAMTALELASKTSKKVDECIELVNGVEQTAIEATAVVDAMRIAHEQFITENNDIRQQLVTDNQEFVESLETSKTTFEANMTSELSTFKTGLNDEKTNYEIGLNNSKTAFEANMTTELNIFKSDLNNSKSTFGTNLNTEIQNIINDAESTINSAVNTKIDEFVSDGTIADILEPIIAPFEAQLTSIDSLVDNREKTIINVLYPPKGFPNAKGDGVTDDWLALQTILNTVKTSPAIVVFPAGKTFLLTDQLTVYPNTTIIAYGATLKWTNFGTTLKTDVAMALTGNGIRLNSNTKLYGGKYQASNVPNPSGKSIPTEFFSGAFWNIIAIGHFNTATTEPASFGTFTENIVIKDIETNLINGEIYTGIFIAGASRNIVIDNWSDNHSNNSTTQLSSFETSWGASSGVSYHPHNISLNKVNIVGYQDCLSNGFHISGTYDINLTDITIKDIKSPLKFYIGDPAETIVNAGQLGKICKGLKASKLFFTNFDIGIFIVGDANGSTYSERKTHDVNATITDFTLIGQGAIDPYAINPAKPWSSNYGIYVSDANFATFISGEIISCNFGVSIKTASGGAFTAPKCLEFKNITIHNIANNAMSLATIERSKICDNIIFDYGKTKTSSQTIGIRLGGNGNIISGNIIGKNGETGEYGFLYAVATLLTPDLNLLSNNIFCGNTIGAHFGGTGLTVINNVVKSDLATG